MDVKYAIKIAEQQNLALKQVNSVFQMHSEGATIPFMARYRKEATGNLDEVKINDIVEGVKYFQELDKRKDTVIKTIESLGKLTPELKDRIENSFDATELEDIYLPYKPKRKTRATTAIEKGLEPLAKMLFEQEEFKVEEEAGKYVGEKVKDTKEALQGARDIIAEWISENHGEVTDNMKERVNEFESRRNQNINTGNSGKNYQQDSTKLLDNQFRVAYLIWRNPYMAAGSNTFIHSMIEACGWKNALENFSRYPEVQLNQDSTIHINESLPDLSSADIILLSSEPYPFAQKHIDEIQSLLPGKLILLVDGEMFSWYGSRLLKSADYFRSLNDQIHDLIGR